MDPGRLPYVDVVWSTHGAQLAVKEESSRRSRHVHVSTCIDLPRLPSVVSTPSLDAVLGQHLHSDRERNKARCICINPSTSWCSPLAQR